MSLGPQWCLGVLFGCFCLGKRLALGRGQLERTWAARLRRGPAATGSGGGKTSGDAKNPSHAGFVLLASVLQALARRVRVSQRMLRTDRRAP